MERLADVRDRAGDAAVARVLELADVPHTLAELEDPSRWVSDDARIRLFAAVVEVLDDPQVMFTVGATLMTSTINPSLLALAHELGLEVVGEGVETPAQLAALHDAGCGLFQGYLLGRPGPLAPASSPVLLGAGQA